MRTLAREYENHPRRRAVSQACDHAAVRISGRARGECINELDAIRPDDRQPVLEVAPPRCRREAELVERSRLEPVWSKNSIYLKSNDDGGRRPSCDAAPPVALTAA